MAQTPEDLTYTFPKVTRVEVIDASGRAFVRRYEGTGAYVAVQDDGRTLKLFAGSEDESSDGTR